MLAANQSRAISIKTFNFAKKICWKTKNAFLKSKRILHAFVSHYKIMQSVSQNNDDLVNSL